MTSESITRQICLPPCFALSIFRPGEGRAQEHAAEALILAASDVSTRQRWIEGEGSFEGFSCWLLEQERRN